MVTTFLLDTDIQKSANYLDNKRLFKQALEANTAIEYLAKIDYVANLFQLIFPVETTDIVQTFLSRVAWAKTVVETYKTYCKQHATALIYNKQTKTYRQVLTNVNNTLLAEETYLFKGYVNHPAILAWVGHSNGLREYYNIHRLTAIQRGYKTTIQPQIIDGSITYPWWTSNPILIVNYWNNLYWKEIMRVEKPWYVQPAFNDKLKILFDHPLFGTGNLWISKLDYQTVTNIYQNQVSNLNFYQICDTITYLPKDTMVPSMVDAGHLLYLIYLNNVPVEAKTALFEQLKTKVHLLSSANLAYYEYYKQFFE